MYSLSKPLSDPKAMPFEVRAVEYDMLPLLVLSVLCDSFTPGTKLLLTPLRSALGAVV